jgi:hypothetical protein
VIPMKENVGMIDRMIRFILAIIFIILGFVYSPWWFLPAAIALITGLVGWCGLYTVFGWSTCGAGKPLPKPAKKAKKK